MATLTEIVSKHFQTKPVFNRKEVAELLGNQQKATTALSWMIKSGKLLRINTGLYYLKRPDEWYNDHVVVNPQIIAGCYHLQGVLGYHSALKCYGVANSVTYMEQIAVNKNISTRFKSFSFQDIKYEFYKSDLSFGIDSSVVADVRIRHFSRERIILEGLMYPDRFLGMSEFLQSVEGFSWINIENLMGMIEKYPKKTVSMRLGWLLEKYREKWHIEGSILNKLEKNRPSSVLLLLKSNTKKNAWHSRWNLLVPKTIDGIGEF
ncbi:MAG: hypothetical protein KAU06_08475 [Candidatus Marinimicrobia bacterium]|nr:hypothetical protein [Candidatus Neomarinimicrobiota bacterium]